MDIYTKERKKALEDIRKVIVKRIEITAHSPLGKNNPAKSLPEHLEVQETFRWLAQAAGLTFQLEEGKMSLRDVFAQYAKPTAADIPGRRANGRDSAFEDVLKALELAERDFDAVYKPLSKDDLKRWQKVHPIEDKYLEYAWKENMRHFMKQAIAGIRKDVEDLRAAPPKPSGGKFTFGP